MLESRDTIGSMKETLMPLYVFIHHLDDPFVFIFIVLVTTLGIGYVRREYALGLFLSVAVTFCFTSIMKQLFAIQRPETMLIVTDGYRFPSLHAAITGAIMMSLALALVRIATIRWVRTALILTSIGIVILVDASRVVLNVHKPIDVVVGSVIGIGISFAIHQYLQKHSTHI